MNAISFRPGADVGIVAPWFVAVVDSAQGGELGDALIRLADEAAGGGLDELIDAISRLQVRTLPSFVVAVVELHVVRLLIRGDLAALTNIGGVVEQVDASGFRTWRELSVPRPCDVVIGAPSELAEPSFYWTTGGVLPVSNLVVDCVAAREPRSHDRTAAMPPGLTPPESGGDLGDAAVGTPPQFTGISSDASEASGGADDVSAAEPSPSAEPVSAFGANEAPVQVSVADEVPVHEALVDQDDGAAAVAFGAEERAHVEPELGDTSEGSPDGVASLGPRVDSSELTLPPDENWPTGEEPIIEIPGSDGVAPIDDPYADLWHTQVRAVEDAAYRVEIPAEFVGAEQVSPERSFQSSGVSPGTPVAGGPAQPVQDGDHDGHTRAVDSLRAAAQAFSDGGGEIPGEGGPNGGVASSMCINGHANPPFALKCRRCLAPVNDAIERVPRADGGVLVLPSGERVEIDRTLLIGRSPKAAGLFTGEPPRLIELADHSDVSRTHVIIELSGWTATVTDQDSLNGTEVVLPGKQPERLRPHQPVALVVGARIVLADEVTLKVEGG